ncbi:MAG: hypothetical protein CML29_17415 [Rhizobiales bacterium]|nr:hypothetical protein [Hyphomicrobiales bacterium]MBA68639.1 hypothetical protein [Hyphomicrobiales bacterium]
MKQVSIMELMAWAFREELPKVERQGSFATTGAVASTAAMIAQVGELGTLVDVPVNQWGVVPVMVDDEPHPDALRVGEAVRALTGKTVTPPDGWNPFPDWADEDGLVAAAVASALPSISAHAGRTFLADAVCAAVLGKSIDWRCDPPRRRMVMRGGKPAWFAETSGSDASGQWVREIDGYDRRSKRPRPGAYRKYELTRPIHGDISTRFRRAAWASGLRLLARQLAAEGLAAHELTNRVPRIAPWEPKENVPAMFDFS